MQLEVLQVFEEPNGRGFFELGAGFEKASLIAVLVIASRAGMSRSG
jgi:hypothetical protein